MTVPIIAKQIKVGGREGRGVCDVENVHSVVCLPIRGVEKGHTVIRVGIKLRIRCRC